MNEWGLILIGCGCYVLYRALCRAFRVPPLF